MSCISRFIAAGVAAAALVLGASTAGMAQEARARAIATAGAGVATVEAIDRQTREITLKSDSGTTTISGTGAVRTGLSLV